MTDSSSEDMQINYIEHLQLEKLLTAQKFISPHPEESIFVIMHQSYELWFLQVIHDVERVIVMLESDDIAQATWLLQRLGHIFQTLDTQLGILEMMSAADFQEFRPYSIDTDRTAYQHDIVESRNLIVGMCEHGSAIALHEARCGLAALLAPSHS